MYQTYEEKRKEKYGMENLNPEAYIEFVKQEKECDAHNVAEAMKLMNEEWCGLKPKEFNKYKRFIKDNTNLKKFTRRLTWKSEWNYKG